MSKIDIPDSWLLPQYRLAQKVKQGVIIGMTYHPPDTQRAAELGEGWLYSVLFNEFSEDIEIIQECFIETALPETHEEVQQKIDFHKNRITFLTAQLEK